MKQICRDIVIVPVPFDAVWRLKTLSHSKFVCVCVCVDVFLYGNRMRVFESIAKHYEFEWLGETIDMLMM